MQVNETSSSKNLMFVIKVLLLALILWSNLLAISLAAGIEHPIENGQEVSAKVDQSKHEIESDKKTSAWSLMDWSQYRQKFKKNYSSLSQQLLRQKIFMCKQIQVFLRWIDWRRKKRLYFTVINQYTDSTPEEERERMSGGLGNLASDDEDDEDIMNDEQASEALLKELEERGDSYEMTSNDQKPLERHKRSLMSDLMNSNFDWSSLVRVPSSTDFSNVGLNIKWVVPSNNPDYQQVEAPSFGVGLDSSKVAPDIPKEEAESIATSISSWIALPKQVIAEAEKSAVNWLRSNSFRTLSFRQRAPENEDSNSVEAASNVGPEVASDDNVIIDWRKSGCVAPPMDQGECHSCYSFSTMAFFEWAFCMRQDRTLTPLSVQYLISCGPQYAEQADTGKEIQIYGCGGGRARQALLFIEEYGLELAANIPYLDQDTQCPVAKKTPRKNKGYIRPNQKQYIRMRATTSQLEQALKAGPVIVNFRNLIDFSDYGGGILGDCHDYGGHAMLIVGHGEENGIPYLLIKNSYGTNWGMDGYLKFDRNYTQKCIKDFIVPRVRFPSKKALNRRVKAYLAGGGLNQSDKKKSSLASSKSDLGGFFDMGRGGLFSFE